MESSRQHWGHLCGHHSSPSQLRHVSWSYLDLSLPPQIHLILSFFNDPYPYVYIHAHVYGLPMYRLCK